MYAQELEGVERSVRASGHGGAMGTRGLSEWSAGLGAMAAESSLSSKVDLVGSRKQPGRQLRDNRKGNVIQNLDLPLQSAQTNLF